MGRAGWLISEETRSNLLARYPGKYSEVIAHHITLGYAKETEPLSLETSATIRWFADDHRGIEALVVAVGGTHLRPDGSAYHITWSLDRSRGYKPVMSNAIWQRCREPALPGITIPIIPTYFK